MESHMSATAPPPPSPARQGAEQHWAAPSAAQYPDCCALVMPQHAVETFSGS